MGKFILLLICFGVCTEMVEAGMTSFNITGDTPDNMLAGASVLKLNKIDVPETMRVDEVFTVPDFWTGLTQDDCLVACFTLGACKAVSFEGDPQGNKEGGTSTCLRSMADYRGDETQRALFKSAAMKTTFVF